MAAAAAVDTAAVGETVTNARTSRGVEQWEAEEPPPFIAAVMPVRSPGRRTRGSAFL
jgi:hypothetical protein